MFYFLIILCLCTTAGIRYGWTHTLLQVINPQIWAVCLTKSSILSSETMRTSKIKKKKNLESQFEANLSNLEVRLPFQYLAYSKIPVLFMIQSRNLKSEHWVSQLYEPKVLGVLAAVSVLSINIAI